MEWLDKRLGRLNVSKSRLDFAVILLSIGLYLDRLLSLCVYYRRYRRVGRCEIDSTISIVLTQTTENSPTSVMCRVVLFNFYTVNRKKMVAVHLTL